MIFEIVLVSLLVIETYVIVNLMVKTEKLETWIQNIENEITQVQTDIKDIDDKGYFESDDEVGEKFSQINKVIQNIETLRGDNASNAK
tara:strand:- start:50 stop:313 length:264 start_codon:yes stop_codon:yes gene_type:complete